MVRSPRFHDRYDLPLSTASAAAVEHYVASVDLQLSFNAGAAAGFTRAIEADEGFGLAHAGLAASLHADGKVNEAKASAAHAYTLAAGSSRREQQHIAIITTFVEGLPQQALGLLREHLMEFPRDAPVVALLRRIFNLSSDQDRHQQWLALLDRVAAAYGDAWWFLADYGFVQHELRSLAASRRLSERSLAQYPRNASAVHNMGHVFYESSHHAEGTTFFEQWLPAYDRQAPLHGHLTWHQALHELSVGHYQRVLDLYERDISPVVAREARTLLDAASLLWRHHIYGCTETALPWEPVGSLAADVARNLGSAFMNAHIALAFAGAGDEQQMRAFVDGLRDLDAQGHPIAGSVVLPLALGVGAFAAGTYAEAVQHLEAMIDRLVCIGGSNAQREVFEDTLLEAYLRAEQFDRVEPRLRQRLARRPSGRDFFWLARAQAGMGERDAAQASLETAQRYWAGADPDATEPFAIDRLRRQLAAW